MVFRLILNLILFSFNFQPKFHPKTKHSGFWPNFDPYIYTHFRFWLKFVPNNNYTIWFLV